MPRFDSRSEPDLTRKQVDKEVHGITALIAAAQADNHHAAAVLLQARAAPDYCTIAQDTALCVAASCGSEQVLELLIQSGAQLDKPARVGWSALVLASLHANSACVQKLLEAKASVNMQVEGRCALGAASQMGHLEIAQQLLNAKANVNCRSEVHLTSPLSLALGARKNNVAELLMNAGARVLPSSRPSFSGQWDWQPSRQTLEKLEFHSSRIRVLLWFWLEAALSYNLLMAHSVRKLSRSLCCARQHLAIRDLVQEWHDMAVNCRVADHRRHRAQEVLKQKAVRDADDGSALLQLQKAVNTIRVWQQGLNWCLRDYPRKLLWSWRDSCMGAQVLACKQRELVTLCIAYAKGDDMAFDLGEKIGMAVILEDLDTLQQADDLLERLLDDKLPFRHFKCCGVDILSWSVAMYRVASTAKLVELGYAGPDMSGSALIAAAQADNHHAAAVLLQARAAPDYCTIAQDTALCVAASCGSEQVLELLIQSGAQLDKPARVGWSALVLASLHANSACVQKLLEAKASVNMQVEGRCALGAASQMGHLEIAQQLLNARADPRLGFHHDESCLAHAINRNDQRMIELLLAHGCELHHEISEGLTPLLHACMYASVSVASYLLTLKADVNQCTQLYGSPLEIARWRQLPALEELLVVQGARDVVAVPDATYEQLTPSPSRESKENPLTFSEIR